MKKLVNISLSGRGFSIDEDAYATLRGYLGEFKNRISSEVQWKEVMDDIERRISELFTEKLGGGYKDVVSISMVKEVIMLLGLPDGTEYNFDKTKAEESESVPEPQLQDDAKRILYRNKENCAIGGVCSGLALYLDVDVKLLRILFLIMLLMGTSGFWIYAIFWIVVPKAVTPLEKCQMYGLPVTAENLSKFANKK